MRGLTLLVVLAAALAAASIAMPGAEARGPTVRLSSPAPLMLRGVGFAPFESVRLAVTLGTTKVVRGLRATRAGSFTAKFVALTYDRCHGSLTIRATGSRGSRVSWELTPFECPNDGEQ